MNWYKRIQSDIFDNQEPNQESNEEYEKRYDRDYHNIGHYDEMDGLDAGFSEGISLWVADGVGRNFQRKDFDIDDKWDSDDNEEYWDIAHDQLWPQNILGKGFHGRYDHRIKTVSITRPYDNIVNKSVPIERIPESLIRTLLYNYGKDVKVMALPERIYL